MKGFMMRKMNDREEHLESGVDVSFQRTEAETYAEAYMNGYNTSMEHYDEDEVFTVTSGYKAWYVVGDKSSRLSPGTYRFHGGKMQVCVHGEWKCYRYDDDDFFDENRF